MKRFLIVLIGLLCAPLVAYGAWRLVCLYISTGMSLELLVAAIILAAVLAFGFFLSYDLTATLAFISTRNNILHRYKKKLITEDQKNFLIEEVDEKRFAAMKAHEQRKIEQADKYYTWTIGRIMSVFLIIIFLATIVTGIENFYYYEHLGNIIVTKDAIYSTNCEKIADPEPYGWQKIERDGETYIQYGSWDDSEIYDLNGNLVKVEVDLYRLRCP